MSIANYFPQLNVDQTDSLAILFFFDLWRQGANNSVDIIPLFIDALMSFAVVLGVCEFGERLIQTFNEVNDAFDQFKWHLFPCDVRHMLATLIMFAQKPVKLDVFGSISCSRITLKIVGKISITFAQN